MSTKSGIAAAGLLGSAFFMSGNLTPPPTQSEPTPEQKERIMVVQTCSRIAANLLDQGGLPTRAATQTCVQGYYVAKNLLSQVVK